MQLDGQQLFVMDAKKAQFDTHDPRSTRYEVMGEEARKWQSKILANSVTEK